MTFSPKLNILPASQRALWKELKATPKHFVLYGGTALALRLGHRVSEDFDFFTNATFEPQDLAEQILYLPDGNVTLLRENTLTVVLDRNGPVSVSFFGGLGLTRVSSPDAAIDNGVQVASLLDVAGCKMAVVQKRAEAKDYLDIAALLESGISLPKALAAAKAIYGDQFEPRTTLRALSYFADGDLPKLPASIQNALRTAAIGVKLDELPVLIGKRDLASQGDD
jgi:nucleotidyltransferase AbiEii toxin of type IV toxin-antitoxin system